MNKESKITFLESITWTPADKAWSTCDVCVYVIKPNPLDLFVTGSFITTASWTVPYCSK